MWSVAPRVRRSGLRGKEVRWAPTTAMSIVVAMVGCMVVLFVGGRNGWSKDPVVSGLQCHTCSWGFKRSRKDIAT